MKRYASLAGLSFNASKTGAVCVGEKATVHKDFRLVTFVGVS